MTEQNADFFPALLERLRLMGGGADARQLLEDAVREHPGDPRLLLLLAAERVHGADIDGGEAAYIAALQVAPGMHIARFQLGLLQLSSARPAAALSTWAPLQLLEERDPLRVFTSGLACLARDEFNEARRLLNEGIQLNQENPPLNRDMALVLERLASATGWPGGGDDAGVAGSHYLVSSYGKVS